MKIINSNIVTAFNAKTIGTKVIDGRGFGAVVFKAVAAFDFASQRIPVVTLPDEALNYIEGGMGRHTGNPDHYVIRQHWSGQVHLYLKRGMELQPKAVSVVVNTREAYLADPDVKEGSHEWWRVQEEDATHVLIAVLSNYFDKPPPLPPSTFIRNLAGANNEALAWTADEIRAKAREIQEFHEGWCVVAD